MKKILINIIFLSFIISFQSFSQNSEDVLRYSQSFYQGTARSSALANAFGSLGGDFTAISINPAGLGVYKGYQIHITPGFNFSNVDATYFNQSNTDNAYKVNLSSVGMVGSFYPYNYEYKVEGDNSEWESVNFAFGYNCLNNFNKNTLFEGMNASSSIFDKMIDNENNGNTTALGDLAFETFIMNKVEETGEYWTEITDRTRDAIPVNLLQNTRIAEEGYLGEYSISIGANYKHKFYLGMSINFQKIDYDKYDVYSETDLLDSVADFKSMTLTNKLNTTGSGTNFKFGMIIRPIDMLRLGLAIHTPTWFKLEDEYSRSMSSSFDNGDAYSYNIEKQYFKYEITTPTKFIGSLGLIFEQGLISIDYELIDYSTSRLKSDNYTFNTENQDLKNNIQNVSNIRIGGELKLDMFYLRGGYAYYGSPYKDALEEDADYSLISGGFGVKIDELFIDLAYTVATQKSAYRAYDRLYDDDNNVVNVENQNKKFILTLGMKF